MQQITIETLVANAIQEGLLVAKIKGRNPRLEVAKRYPKGMVPRSKNHELYREWQRQLNATFPQDAAHHGRNWG